MTAREAYLDHAATTPVRQVAAAAMVEELGRTGNASSLHGAGRVARRTVEEARESLAEDLGARPSEVIWTSGGTEADNLAVKGLYWGRSAQDSRRTRVLVSAVEHHAVLDPATWLADHGADVELLPVDEDGRVRPDAVAEAIDADPATVALVSVMWANNETGAVQPIREVVAAADRHGIPVHCDAVQAVGRLPVDLAAGGMAALSVSAHKVGGPVGVGALLARRDLPLVALTHGGGQERDVRSGTLDVAGVRAFAAATREAVGALPHEGERLSALQRDLLARVRAVDPSVVLRGPEPGADRLPGTLLLTFPGCEGDSLLYLLDTHGVRCSTGSACRAGVPEPSHVLRAMGVQDHEARGTIRLSMGHTSTQDDVDHLVGVLAQVLDRARAAGRTGPGVDLG